MNILEELYYGVIGSPDYDIQDEKPYQTLLSLVIRHESALAETLTEAQKETFHKFKDCVNDLHSMTERKAFTDGFSLAVKIMAEVMATE